MPNVVVSRVDHARDFAARLITFPAHSGVDDASLAGIRSLVSRAEDRSPVGA